MICKKCGAKFEGNFCPKCGTPAEKELTVSPSAGRNEAWATAIARNAATILPVPIGRRA